MPNFQTAVVTKHENPSTTFHVITFEVENPEFEFQPGQFVALKVGEKDIRDYSLASILNRHKFELIIDIKPGGEGSYYIHDLRVGDKVKFLGPLGKFTLHTKDNSQEILFMGTGSGIAPLKCMAEHLLFKEKDPRKIHLYFGLRYCSDIFLHQYFAELDKNYPNFTFTPSLSKPDEHWEGDIGHITELLKRDYQSGENLSAYLCGNKNMIAEATEVLQSLGTPSDRIYSEVYG